MKSFFEKRDPWGHGMAVWVLAGLVFLLPLAWWSIRQIDLENDVENWLPSDDPHAQVLHWYREHFGIEDRVLITWKGSSLGDPRIGQLKDRLYGRLDEGGTRRGGVEYVESILTPQDVIEQMTRREIDREEALRRLQGILIGRGPFHVRLTPAGEADDDWIIERIKREARRDLEIELAVSKPRPRSLLAAFDQMPEPAGDTALLSESEMIDGEGLLSPKPEHDLEISWRGMQLSENSREKEIRQWLLSLRGEPAGGSSHGKPLIESVSFETGAPVAVLVTLSEAGSADSEACFAAIRQVAAEVGIDPADLVLGGRPVAGSALNAEVKNAAWNRAAPPAQLHRRSVLLLAGLVAIGMAFFLLRSARLGVLVVLTAVCTTFLAVALVPVTGGNMNMVLVVMPTLLSVLTISAAIHVVNYWKHCAARYPRRAVIGATRMAKQPCVLASMTTAIGLLSLTTSPLSPVRDFGLYSAIGCSISLAVVLLALPALLQFWPGKAPQPAEMDGSFWNGLAERLARYRVPVLVGTLGLSVACSYGLTRFRTETKVIRYFPSDSRIVQDYEFLEDHLAGVVPVEVVVRFDEQAQRDMNFLDRMEVVRAVGRKVREHAQISGTVSLPDFQPIADPPADDASFFQKARFNKKAHVIESRIKEDEAETSRAFLITASGPTAFLDESQQPFTQAGDELWRINAQASILTDFSYAQLTRNLDAAAGSVLKYHPGASHVVTGLVPLFLRTQQAVLESLISSFALAFALIAIVMAVLLKNPLSGLITMLPNVLPIGVVFGLISWGGLAVDIGTMITASVALGIAVDGTLHMLTWFRSGLEDGLSKRDAVARALSHCGPAMCQTSAVVGIGLLMLFPANLLLVSRFGWLMASLIGTALVSDVIFLPALLVGPLGRLIERTTETKQEGRAEPPEPPRSPEGSISVHRPRAPYLTVYPLHEYETEPAD